MRLRTFLLLCLGLPAACGSPAEVFVGELTAPVVYGDDDRREVYDHPNDDLRRVAQESIAALITTSSISRQPGGDYSLFAFSLKDSRGLCDDEPFGNQPVAASCSGVLIADDLVLTAGHCISRERPCEEFKYVVYSCERVALESDPPTNDLTPDFAVVQLDRPVEGGHTPVTIRPATPLEQGDPIAMIGFGSGLPAKIDSGASVADARADRRDFFVVNLDAFEGHSGSATFDAESRLAGILLGGRVPDYVTDPTEGCARANVFADSEAGEVVHNIAPIVAALCDEGLLGDERCAPDACDGSPCGAPSVPDGGGGSSGAVAAGGSGCSAATSAPGTSGGWLMMLLLGFAALRLRQTSA
jgi:MYXO-CTERM domain-containing protein